MPVERHLRQLEPGARPQIEHEQRPVAALDFIRIAKLSLQEAIDAPTFHSTHFPSSFYPREAHAGGLVLESRIAEATRKELEMRGHKVKETGAWSNGKVMGVRLEQRTGVLSGGVSPRGQIGYVTGD